MNDYVLQVGRHRLHLGLRAEPIPRGVDSADAASGTWNLPRRPLTARQIVEGLDPLLEAVCLRLGDDIDRRPLLQSLAATLAIDRPESSLPLAALNFPDSLRRELTLQAAEVGKQIATWAADVNGAGVARSRFGRDVLARLELRSRCEGHPWTPPATALLTGERGGPTVMQLYNEWLHQLVLLRDALLPFENWDAVPLPLHLHDDRGLRGIEPARETFLAGFLTRIATHASIVAYARALFDRDSILQDGDVYAFQSELGVVLPAVIGRDEIANAPKGLLTWHPAIVAEPQPGRTLPFRYAWADYLAAPRNTLGKPSGGQLEDGAAIVAEDAALWLEIGADGRTWRIDLGQCLRGQRFAYRPAAGAVPREAIAVTHYDAGAALGQPGLVMADAGVHVFDTGGDPLLTLALLGKIYPENVVVAENSSWDAVLAAGKGYGAKFVLFAGDDLPFGADLREGSHRLVEQAAKG
jgi:hypothetical protein